MLNILFSKMDAVENILTNYHHCPLKFGGIRVKSEMQALHYQEPYNLTYMDQNI